MQQYTKYILNLLFRIFFFSNCATEGKEKAVKFFLGDEQVLSMDVIE